MQVGEEVRGYHQEKNINTSMTENLHLQSVAGIPFIMLQSASVVFIKPRSCHYGISGKLVPTLKSYRVKRRMSREHYIRC